VTAAEVMIDNIGHHLVNLSSNQRIDDMYLHDQLVSFSALTLLVWSYDL